MFKAVQLTPSRPPFFDVSTRQQTIPDRVERLIAEYAEAPLFSLTSSSQNRCLKGDAQRFVGDRVIWKRLPHLCKAFFRLKAQPIPMGSRNPLEASRPTEPLQTIPLLFTASCSRSTLILHLTQCLFQTLPMFFGLSYCLLFFAILLDNHFVRIVS